MDKALTAEAARAGVSKAFIIRRLVAEHTGVGVGVDPIEPLIGQFEGAPGDVDEVVYDR